jgi:Flp pilus assembly protein TadG
MVAYGIYFGAAHSVQQLSADAARTAIAGLSAEERQTLARRFIERNAEGYLFIDPDKLDVVIGDSTADGSQFDVTLSYDATDLPIWGLWERLPMPSRTILRRSTIRMGGI